MSEQPVISTPEGKFNVDLRGVHYDFLKDRVPGWFNQATTQRQEELANHEMELPRWYLAATAQQRSELAASHTRYRETLNQVENSLGDIEDVKAFAEQPLKDAIKQRFNLELDVNNVYFARKYGFKGRDDLFGAFVFEQQSDPQLRYEYRTVSLLEAALANFEPDEERASTCQDCQLITTVGANGGDVIPNPSVFRSHALAVAPHEFAQMCRSLDLGKLYQEHIKSIVQPADETQRTALQAQLQEHQRQLLALSAELAAQTPEWGISADVYGMLKQVITDPGSATLDGKPVTFVALNVFGSVLVGPLLIGPERKGSDRVERLVVFIPNDPQQPLKEYASSGEFMADLRTRLHSASYRRFFSRFVPQREQGVFFRHFNVLYKPANGNGVTGDYPMAARPPRLPLDELKIGANLWELLREAQVRKILADARAVAVPTGDEDREARMDRLVSYLDAVNSVFNLGAFVVPGLGPIMLAVGAAQMCSEVYEGIEAYEQGDTKTMWAHFSSVALNAAVQGTGAKVLPAVKWASSIDHLKPVTLPTGKQVLWNPDMTPYKVPVELAPGTKPDALGLYPHNGQTVLPIDGDYYQVRQEADTGQYRIQHPSRPGAYEPQLEHNHAGAWSHEVEQPLTWDKPTLIRRLGLDRQGLGSATLEQALISSGVEEDVLRQTFVVHDPVPMLLDDTIQHFKAHQALTTFVEQMKSSDPVVYAQADPVLQLQIMRRRGMLPDTPLRVRVSGNNSRVLWEETFGDASRRVVEVSESQLTSGEWLNQVLFSLQGVDPTLREIPGSAEESLAVRAGKLREHIANVVDTFKSSLVEERYQALNATNDPDVRLVLATYPRLPASMAIELLKRLSVEQLQIFRDTGFLPEERIEQARWLEQEVRVSRAYEGLQLDTLAGIDSQRLALRTLETLPGWQRGTRVELRHYSAQGTLLDAIGSPDSTTTKTLVLKDNGLFEAPMPRDFFGATWDQLSATERQNLGFTDAQQLKTAIQQAPLPREPLRTVLLENPVRKPTVDSTLRLLGGGGGCSRQATSVSDVDSVHEQVTDLFPLMDEEAVDAFVRTLGDDVKGGLKHWKAELKTLTRELDTWVYASGPPRADADLRRASYTARDIKNHWRRMNQGPLRLMMRGDLELPLLSADFSHVEGLEIEGIGWSGKTDAFLTSFTHVKHLALIGCRLTELPGAIGEMRSLTSLNLAGNRLKSTPPTSRMLSNLSSLATLDLCNNPLGVAPDVSGMPNLTELNLRNAQIAQWPSGLTALTGLRRVDLSYNHLQEVPPEHLTPPPEQLEAIARINNVLLLENNRFPTDYWQQFDLYWQTLTHTRPELLQGALDGAFDSGNPRLRVMREIYPDIGIQVFRETIWSLGERADAELAQREQEFRAIKRQLRAWSHANERQSYEQFSDRNSASHRIMNCWRADNPLVPASDDTLIDIELDLSGLRLSRLPDLGANFIRPAVLKLNHLNLRTSPEGFLAQCRGVRSLDMSDNHLFELPPAVGNMNELTRLSLRNNRIRLTAESVALLSSRATLRDLILDDNVLGLTPDFSQMTDLRTLQMSNAGIDTWPAGLVERTNLLRVDLSQNSITTIPDSVIAPSDEQLAQTARVTRVTDISENPLTEQTRRQVHEYSRRLEEAGLMSEDLPNALRLTADIAPDREASTGGPQDPFLRWSQGMSPQDASSKRLLWVALERIPRVDPFFDILERLEPTVTDHADMQRRVWEVIESITQDTAESETLRTELLDLAGEPGCCDLAAFSFSNLEVRTLAYKARVQATDQTQGLQLASLSRGLFRLHEVDKIASADIQRSEAIVNDPNVSAADKLPHTQRLDEEVEIRLAYRYGLKDRLQLPGQPQKVVHTNLGDVTSSMLDSAYDTIKALDNSAQELQALLSRDFWQDYLKGKYPSQFDELRNPFHDQLEDLRSSFESKTITEALYDQRARELQAQLQISEAVLIETLTRQEFLEHPLDVAEVVT